MGKLTWQHLGWVYEDQFGISPEEAAEILTKHIFTDTTWKGTHKNPIGRMWKDHANIYAFFTLLDKLKKLKKSDGKNASRKLFYESGEFLYFIQTAGLIYKRSFKMILDYGQNMYHYSRESLKAELGGSMIKLIRRSENKLINLNLNHLILLVLIQILRVVFQMMKI